MVACQLFCPLVGIHRATKKLSAHFVSYPQTNLKIKQTRSTACVPYVRHTLDACQVLRLMAAESNVYTIHHSDLDIHIHVNAISKQRLKHINII